MLTTANTGNLIRDNVWSRELKDVLEEDLMATRWVRMLEGFPDGDTFNIPSIGTLVADDYAEDTDVIYRPMDTGNFTFTISEYLSSATYITKKQMQDQFYTAEVVSTFVPKQRRAIMEHFEATILEQPEAVLGASANGQYAINNTYHRMSGGNSGVIELQDFAYANLSLNKANVPATSRVAIVPPEVAYYLDTISAITSLSDNPMWEGIVANGISTGMKFVKNVYGFDVYMSNFLPDVTDNALPERDGSTTNDFSSTAGKPCYFFSATSDILPFVAAWRQEPQVDYDYNKDKQRHEYVTTARYGKGLIRPENMQIVVTSTAVA
jgi:hypothetical protein